MHIHYTACNALHSPPPLILNKNKNSEFRIQISEFRFQISDFRIQISE